MTAFLITGSYCGAVNADRYTCTLAPGHHGPREAWGPWGEEGPYATWPVEPAANLTGQVTA